MLFVALSSLFSWLRRQRRVESNPCAGLPRPAPATVRERHLKPDEVRWFWAAIDTVGDPFGVLLKLLLLTGQRLREVAGMRRDDELSTDGTTWTLPGTRTKNGRSHVVPMPQFARELISGVQSKGELIFTTTGTTPVSGWSRMKRRLDKAMLAAARKEKPDALIGAWRLHDLRRTAVTGMAELGVRPDVIERVVNHVSGTRGGIAGVYNHAEMLDERKAALERWAAHVEQLVSGKPAKIVDPWGRAR
jgi:integrase